MDNQLDLKYFENIIAYNALKNDVFLSSVVDYLKPEYFDNRDISSIICVVVDYYRKRNCIPSITEIKSKLTTPELKNSFIKVLSSFKNLDKEFNNDELIENSQFFLKQKAVYNAVLSSAEEISSKKADSAKILQTFEDACNINLFHDFGIDMINNPQTLMDRLKEETNYISTGYKWMDNKIKGFATNGKALYVISAATNVGKSIVLTNLASNVARQNKKVVLFTLEMSEEMYGKRAASCLTQLGINGLSENSDAVLDGLGEIRDENPLSCFYIKEFPTKGVTVAALRAYLKKLYNNRKIIPDLIVVDYLNLLLPSVVTGNSYTDIKSITEELRGLSYEFGGTPVLSATQLNRSATNEINPGLETTSESMGLSMTADVQISLWASEEDKEEGRLYMGMQKNRFGPNFGKTALQINWDNLAVHETDDSIFGNDDLNAAASVLDSL